MRNATIEGHKCRLDDAFARVQTTMRAIPNRSLHSDLACYLCVLVSGFFEQAVKTLLRDYVTRCSNQNVLRFYDAAIVTVNAPDWDGVSRLFGRFNSAWVGFLEDNIAKDRKQAVKSIVHQRHSIAHGLQVSMSVRDVKSWYDSIVPLVSQLEDFIFPPPRSGGR